MNSVGGLIISLLLILFLWGFTVFPCTGFTSMVGDRVLIGNNEDYNIDYKDTVVRIHPASEGKYGCLLVGFNRQDFAMGGMNDQGLFYDWFSVPPNDWAALPGKPYYSGFKPENMLEQCANVEEAVVFFQTYNLDIFKENQVFVVDKTGKSAVIAWGEGGLDVVYKEGDYQVVANFYLLHPERGWHPNWRYDTAVDMLENAGEISLELFRSILDAVHVEGSNCTQYSNIYELQKGEIYIFNFFNFDEFIKLNIAEEWNKGGHIYLLPEYFSKIKLINPVEGEVANSSSITFGWQGKGDSHYQLYCSTDPDFKGCVPIEVVPGMYAFNQGRWGLLCWGILFLGIIFLNRKRFLIKYMILLLVVIPLVSCQNSAEEPIDEADSVREISIVVDNLQPGSTYYWKVAASAANDLKSESIVKTFTIEQ
jgi:hypothetical protein